MFFILDRGKELVFSIETETRNDLVHFLKKLSKYWFIFYENLRTTKCQ